MNAKLLKLLFIISVILFTTISNVFAASGGTPGPQPKLPVGVAVGDMLYWDGTTWTLVPAPASVSPTTSPTLRFCNGLPAWGGCFPTGYLSITKDGQYISGTDKNLPVGNSPRTLEIWTRTTWAPSGTEGEYVATIVNWGSGVGGRFEVLELPNGMMSFHCSGCQMTGVSRINDGNWHKLTITFDGSVVQQFIDGVLDNISTSGFQVYEPLVQFSNISTTNNFLYIGRSVEPNQKFLGDLKGVAVYGRVLSPNEIKDQSLPQVTKSGLVSLYDFSKLNKYNMTVVDQTDNTTTLTLTGFE